MDVFSGLSSLTITPPAGPTEGQTTGTFTVATFTDANPGAAAADFTATVSWGDGTTSGASVAATGTPGVFAVLASHSFAEEGSVSLAVRISDGGGSVSGSSATFTVADAALGSLTFNPNIDEGVGTVTVATFTDGNSLAPATDFTATVGWGDGSPASGARVVSLGGGQFAVLASHTYPEETTSPLTLSVQIADAGGSSLGGSTAVTVADAPLSNLVIGLPPSTEGIGTFGVATFSDANTSAPAADFTATITWGDGNQRAALVIPTSTKGVFHLLSSHT